jgi:hypothetical protein
MRCALRPTDRQTDHEELSVRLHSVINWVHSHYLSTGEDTKIVETNLGLYNIFWHADPILGNARNTCKQQWNQCCKRRFLYGSYIGEHNMHLDNRRKCFPWGPCRGFFLKTIGATVQLRVQLWIVNQRATEEEEFPLLRFVRRKCLVKTLQRNRHCGELLPCIDESN